MPGNEKKYQEAMSQGHSAGWDQQWDKAVDFYKQAVEEKPESVQALTSLGMAHFELRHYEDAQKCYTKVLKVTPDDPLLVEKVAQIYERTGRLTEAAEMAMNAAELHLKARDISKAVENWTRVVNLIPGHLKAHSRLAIVFERLGENEQAIHEYIATAALLQEIGRIDEAANAVNKAVEIDPENFDAQRALEMINNNQTLPKAHRMRGVTSALRMAAVREMQESPEVIYEPEQPNPVEEAQQKALTTLAALLFDISTGELEPDETAPRGIEGLFGGGRGMSKVSKHLSQAIDLQTRGDKEAAARELKKSIDAGLNSAAAFYNLGVLYYDQQRQESALRNLQHAINDPDYTLASRILIGEYLEQRGLLSEATVEYLEALKMADMAVGPAERTDGLLLQYELLIEAFTQDIEEKDLRQLCQNIHEMLMRNNWQEHLRAARAQLPGSSTDSLAMPIAEILILSNSREMLESIMEINQIAQKGHFRTAMDEAFNLMRSAPTYLPLHILMGELLLRQNRTRDAIDKFTIIAQTYISRGEISRATDLLAKIVEIAPLDMPARNRLIQHLVDQGMVNEAINEYLNLADVHYRLAQLDNARSTYERALRLTKRPDADRAWGVRIYHQMADIDMQRLDWRKALRVYEQLRTLEPEDEVARKNLVELNLRLGQNDQAQAELDNYLSFLSGAAKDKQAIGFLEKLVQDNPMIPFIHQRLAEYYQQASMSEQAVEQWDKLTELMLDNGDKEGAKQAIRAILVINPPNADRYRSALQRL